MNYYSYAEHGKIAVNDENLPEGFAEAYKHMMKAYCDTSIQNDFQDDFTELQFDGNDFVQIKLN